MISLEIPYEKAGVAAPEQPAVLEEFCVPKAESAWVKPRPAVIICPGGGYDYCSPREAAPVAMRFAGSGVQAFVLWYNCRTPFPTNLLEVAAAVRYVRMHCSEYDIDPGRILVCGFSAGGHLAASLAVHWDMPLFVPKVFPDFERCRPDGQILCYPVITAGEPFTHQGSIDNLVGQPENAEQRVIRRGAASLEEFVKPETPPCFIWHTSDDNCVPVQNTLLYLNALAGQGVPFEAHIYPHGGHGLSLADETTATGEWHLNPVCAAWFADCIRWIRRA